MTLLEQALQIAVKAHIGQTDKMGLPYILHPIRVMMSLVLEEDQVVALLHDVVEDTSVTLMYLRKKHFPEYILSAVKAITHLESEPRKHYIERVMENEIACRVKIADCQDNLKPERLSQIEPQTRERLYKKYNEYIRWISRGKVE